MYFLARPMGTGCAQSLLYGMSQRLSGCWLHFTQIDTSDVCLYPLCRCITLVVNMLIEKAAQVCKGWYAIDPVKVLGDLLCGRNIDY